MQQSYEGSSQGFGGNPGTQSGLESCDQIIGENSSSIKVRDPDDGRCDSNELGYGAFGVAGVPTNDCAPLWLLICA